MEKAGKNIRCVAAELGEPYERIRHYFRLDEIGSRLPPEETWLKLKALLKLPRDYDAGMEVEVTDNVFRNHPQGRNPGDVLTMPTARGRADHFALMPIELAEWCLKSSLPPGGIALDPFMGWGTTGGAALKQGGRFIGVDIDERLLADFALCQTPTFLTHQPCSSKAMATRNGTKLSCLLRFQPRAGGRPDSVPTPFRYVSPRFNHAVPSSRRTRCTSRKTLTIALTNLMCS